MEEEKEKEAVAPPQKRSFLPFILILVIVVLFVVFTAIYYQKSKTTTQNGEPAKEESQKKPFSAVFLTNGQVYFGYLEGWESSSPKLTNIYYLQLRNPQPQQANVSREQIEQAAEAGVQTDQAQPGQPQAPAPAPQQQTQEQQQPQITLVKLGSELHGPIDEIVLNKSQVLFYETLKDDSRVVQAIREYEKKQIEERVKQEEGKKEENK